MAKYPIETANIVLILIGIGLVISGPWIIYKTVTGVLARRRVDPKAKLHGISNGLNFIIALLFFVAGVLFILNNLRGNPLAPALPS